MKRIVDEQELTRRLADLPREIAPEQDAWPIISARISRKIDTGSTSAQRLRTWPLATAASVLMIVALGFFLREHVDPGDDLTPHDSILAEKTMEAERDYPGSRAAGELEYQAALREFMALSIGPGSNQELPALWIEQGWGSLHEVELELTEALRNEPNNDFLNLRLVALRARQIELLRQIAAMDQTFRRYNI